MFVKIYQYEISKEDLSKWKEINDSANKIYMEYGSPKFERFINRKENSIEIIELGEVQFKRKI